MTDCLGFTLTLVPNLVRKIYCHLFKFHLQPPDQSLRPMEKENPNQTEMHSTALATHMTSATPSLGALSAHS